MRVARWILGAAIAAWAASGVAQQPEAARVEEAIASYRAALDTSERGARLEGFRKAERFFSRVVDGGASNPELYTNLGNAALQAEHLGAAVFAYRRALAIDPDHPRAEQNLESMPICVITTEGASEDRERAMALGADEYLTKPIQANKVLSVAKSLLKLES